MEEFNRFFQSLLKSAKLNVSSELSIPEIRFIISKINEYFYTSYKGIGTTTALGLELEYFSEFHKFWEKNHKQVLNPQIVQRNCEIAADCLHEVFIRFGRRPFKEVYEVGSSSLEAVCRVRYFTAPQDFRGSRNTKELLELYEEDPSSFETSYIGANPAEFLNHIGITKLSQNDKRENYLVKSAQLLIENDIEPIELFEFCERDLSKLRSLLLSNRGSGFGNKKTDMFIRDMIVLGVWTDPVNFDKIDVASDINTVKVALRAGIIKTDIVLVSSFIDVFCHQYGLIDEINAKAWRTVWESWKHRYPSECIESPSLMDYLIYRIIGREFCKDALATFRCEKHGHEFKWHSSRNRTCQTCLENNERNRAYVVRTTLPCTEDLGHIYITKNPFVSGPNAVLGGITECPFTSVCKPKDPTFRKLNPPKSISILGQTGWESARTDNDEGGGGLMS